MIAHSIRLRVGFLDDELKGRLRKSTSHSPQASAWGVAAGR